MSKFGDFTTALRFREAVTQIAESVVERMRPTYRYAAVMGINHGTRRVTVRFPGESTDVTIAAGSIMPSAVGQTVRIAGVGGERYVADVVGLSVADRRLIGADTRTVNDNPTVAAWGARTMSGLEFKNGGTIGLPDAHYGIMTLSPWGDDSGGGVHQLAFGPSGMFYRYGTRGGNTWGPWTSVAGSDTAWAELLPASGWSPYQSGIGLEWTPRYRRKGGIVYVEGLMNGGPTGLVTTLPVGFRPGSGVSMRWNGTGGNGTCRVDFNANGTVVVNGEGTQTTGWHSLQAAFIAEN
jgi:hypothetical protein